ncbi:cadherin-like beta sandwich domain-containing protein [Clostridium saccharoperbutylacetonicum]|uniref:cadherin-like beta sandwich domain-containing protein n=1 Tax=Clostridium saccharoperbutylacetonicum TaxID=36745 RepID=UPI000983C5EE|nr:cadherin-like beta sandwich domain-containing protein [Clostridium saccharoperbutylacetonicum]AQR97852.1 autolysin [Clostridium saccharoperbutylacetonicum]NSB33744.1 glucan-binding YG repeat protein [Clostridium saccharoperbutylacetonicum]
MNKNIKRIISLALVLGILNVLSPAINLNFMDTKAYANTTDGVTNIRLKASGGNSLSLYSDNDYDDTVSEVKEPGTYYAKTSLSKVQVDVSGVDSDNVRIFDGTSSSTRGTREGGGISLSDTTTIVVRIYNQNPGAVKYSDKENIASEYRIKVKYLGSSDSENDNVYLKDITVSYGDINFSKTTYNYNVNVPDDINEITIGARPDSDSNEYDNYKVKIDGTKVDEDDKYKEKVSLNKGNNKIEIYVEDDSDNSRTYTLNVFRGTDTGNAISNSNQAANNIKGSWVQTNGKWQYNDESGNIVKNKWVQNYYVDAEGNRATDLLNVDGLWYYFGQDGIKKIGWQKINGIWHHFDEQGIMQIGWMKDVDGKYYYLNSNGAMASNTTIGGYKLGADGVWIE